MFNENKFNRMRYFNRRTTYHLYGSWYGLEKVYDVHDTK